jgi:hypothetical protein
MAAMSGDPEAAHTGAHDLWHDFNVRIMPLAVGKDCVYIKSSAQDPATFVSWTTIFNTNIQVRIRFGIIGVASTESMTGSRTSKDPTNLDDRRYKI